MLLQRKKVRLAADAAKRTSEYMEDVFTGSQPEIWRGNDVQFELGLFIGGTMLTDLSNIASLTLEVKSDSDRDGIPLITKTLAAVDLDATLTAETWADKTKQHALLALTGAETNIALNGDETTYWLAVSIVTNDSPARNITIQATKLLIVEDGTGSASAPQNNAENYHTKDQADVRFIQKHADGAWFREYDGRLYHYIQSTGLWYPEIATIKDGVPVLTLGEGVSL